MKKILGKRNKKNAEYLVKWLDYGDEHNKWINRASFIENMRRYRRLDEDGYENRYRLLINFIIL